MADKKDTGSLVAAGTVAAPTAIGAGLSLRDIIRGGGYLPQSKSSVTSAMETLDAIASNRPPVISAQDHIAFINKNAKYFASSEGSESARRAWLEAVKSADPIAQAPFKRFSSSLQGLPVDQVTSAISDIMGRNPATSLSSRIYSKYYRNLNILQGQEIAYTFSSAPAPISSKGFKTLPSNLGRIMSSLESGMDATSTYQWITRQGFEQDLGSWSVQMTKRGGGRVGFLLPATEKGTLIEGASLKTRYIAPDVGIFNPTTGELSRMSRSEFFLKEIEQSVLPDIKSGRLSKSKDIEKAIQEVRKRTIHALETVPNLPFEEQTAAMQDYIQTRSKAIDIIIEQDRKVEDGQWKFSSAHRVPSAQELSSAMEKHNLYGGTSPTAIAKGRVQTIDLSQRFMVPGAVDWGRRPETLFREYGLTQQSSDMLSKASDGRYDRYRSYEAKAMRKTEERLLRPNLKALYLDPDKYSSLMQEMGMGDGEAIARRDLSKYMEFEGSGRKHLSSLRDDLAKKLMAGESINPKAGEILGWTNEGNPFMMKEGMQDFKAFTHQSAAQGPHYSLYYRDVQRLRSADKFFGDIKALVHLEDTRKLRSRIQDKVSTHRFLQNVDIIASMDELKKDTGKHTRQITSALGEIINDRASKAPMESQAARLFYSNPETVAKMWSELATKEGSYKHKVWVQEAMNFATQHAQISARQFGAVFGATGAVLGQEAAEEMVKSATSNASFLEEMRRGFAGGVAKISYGGPASLTGAGAMGSLEPRAFDVLKGPSFVGIGDPLSKEFAQRLAYTNPEKVAVNKALSRTLASIAGEEKGRVAGAQVWKAGSTGFAYSPEEFENFISRGGGYINPGKGMKDIFVPGAETLQAMRPHDIGGVKVRTSLSDIYHGLARELDTIHTSSEVFDTAKARSSIELASRELWKQAAPGGKGMGAVLRGHIEGSRFFRGVSRAGKITHLQLAQESSNAMVVGVPKTQATKMFAEMEEIYGRETMSEMRKSFMAGEEIGGVLARHPFIGEHSLQPIRLKGIDAPGTQLIIPEIQTNIRAKLEGGGIVEKKLSLGPLIGLAGDKDADIYSAMLVSPDNEKLVKNATLNSDAEFLRRYQQHQVRYQLLKAGKGNAAADEAMTVAHLMRADVQKLGTVQRWVPKLSVELSSAKRALRGVGGAGAADASMLLEWLEQTPISAKHLSASEAEKSFESTLGAITSSLQYRDASRMQDVVQSIVKDDVLSKELLTKNVTIEKGAGRIAEITGGKPLTEIKGININQASQTIMDAMTEYASTGESRRAELAVGRGAGLTIREIPEVLAKQSAHMAAGAQGVFSSVSRAAVAVTNNISALGQSAIKNYKPLAMGFAASLGLAAALSDPIETIGPGVGLIPQGKLLHPGKGSNRMSPETVMPPSQALGNPTAPNMLNSRRAMIAPNGGSKYVVNATVPSGTSPEALAGVLSSSSGIRGPVNVNLRDSRQISNRYIDGNKVS